MLSKAMKRHSQNALIATSLAIATPIALADDIKVGSVAGVTGPIAELVAPMVAGRNLAAQHVNEQGGLLNGDQYALVLSDSQCDPKAGVDAGNKVINVEQVVAIVGPNCSGATNALAQSVSVPAGVVVLSDSATAPSISEMDDNDLMFRVAPSDAYQGVALAKLAVASGFKNVAITYSNDDYNAGLAGVFDKAFQEMGGTVTGNQMHEPNKASYRSELSTLASSKPADALAVFAYYGSSGITILRNSLENSLFDKFLAADGNFDVSVIEQIGAANLKDRIQVTQAASDSEDASYQAFSNMYEAATEYEAGSPYAAHGYDAAFMIALAIEKAGSADRSKVAAALRAIAGPPGVVIRPGEWSKAKAALAKGEDINYEGASGNVDFDENGDVTGMFSVNIIGEDGNWSTQLLKE